MVKASRCSSLRTQGPCVGAHHPPDGGARHAIGMVDDVTKREPPRTAAQHQEWEDGTQAAGDLVQATARGCAGARHGCGPQPRWTQGRHRPGAGDRRELECDPRPERVADDVRARDLELVERITVPLPVEVEAHLRRPRVGASAVTTHPTPRHAPSACLPRVAALTEGPPHRRWRRDRVATCLSRSSARSCRRGWKCAKFRIF